MIFFTGRASAFLIGPKAAQGQKLVAKNYLRFHFDPGNDDDDSDDNDDEDDDFNVDWIGIQMLRNDWIGLIAKNTFAFIVMKMDLAQSRKGTKCDLLGFHKKSSSSTRTRVLCTFRDEIEERKNAESNLLRFGKSLQM